MPHERRNPKVGDTVLYYPNGADKVAAENDSRYVPAMITAVCNSREGRVNLKVFPDTHGLLWRTGIFHKQYHVLGEAFWEFP